MSQASPNLIFRSISASSLKITANPQSTESLGKETNIAMSSPGNKAFFKN
jgi:hypothetical protein